MFFILGSDSGQCGERAARRSMSNREVILWSHRVCISFLRCSIPFIVLLHRYTQMRWADSDNNIMRSLEAPFVVGDASKGSPGGVRQPHAKISP